MPSVTSEGSSYRCFLFFWLHKQLKFKSHLVPNRGSCYSWDEFQPKHPLGCCKPKSPGLRESWGYGSPFTGYMPKWQVFKFITGNSPQICCLFWTSFASVTACKSVILKGFYMQPDSILNLPVLHVHWCLVQKKLPSSCANSVAS